MVVGGDGWWWWWVKVGSGWDEVGGAPGAKAGMVMTGGCWVQMKWGNVRGGGWWNGRVDGDKQ
jgi:hypothetical protein